MQELLIELLSEEIPARLQRRAAEDFKNGMIAGFSEAGLTFDRAEVNYTPRRLVLVVHGLSEQSLSVTEERKGPHTDAPEQAIEGFLRAVGVDRDHLEVRETKKGTTLFAVVKRPGRPAQEIVAEVLENVIRKFPWPKSMLWGEGKLRWVRPLRRLLCILSENNLAQVVPFEIDGLVAGNMTEGHRFMAPEVFTVNCFMDYVQKLRQAKVEIRADVRSEKIWKHASELALNAGLVVLKDNFLLEEVTGLVEWPVVLMGDIAKEYLALPHEILQTSMKEHQKFFSVLNPTSKRIEKLIIVANRETADCGKTIRLGNQRVLSARLADAKFFWENDSKIAKQGMHTWLEMLKKVTFHNQLGSQYERVERLVSSAALFASVIPNCEVDRVIQSARVSKVDLNSDTVGEFPELQGIMGGYFATQAGYHLTVSDAAKNHYKPLGPSDEIPHQPISIAVALADKLDTLTGFWAIKKKPTGSKDPFALRRSALGVIRIILENELRIPLSFLVNFFFVQHYFRLMNDVKAGELEAINVALIEWHDLPLTIRKIKESEQAELAAALQKIKQVVLQNTENLLDFFYERLKVFLRTQNIRHDIIDACVSMSHADDLTLLVHRIRALSTLLQTDDGENLIQGFKRANNILTQAEACDGVPYSELPDVTLAEQTSEHLLFSSLERVAKEMDIALQNEDFTLAVQSIGALREPINAFFENVMVNVDQSAIRENRLRLLNRVRCICLKIADLTCVES
ncbi:MAG: glycine--tRNA ligase subunit beta [Aestuariivita sp.]|nr:glycine--tRNA ligase subunit beta [Aestuariivita sp.]